MEGDETFFFIISIIGALLGLFNYGTGSLSPLYLRRATGIGLVRLALILAVGWIVFVLYNFAAPSVVGIYRLFYIVIGLAILLWFGIGGSSLFGARYRVDVVERNNLHAAMVIAGVVLATGMIYGGSLWGEADPEGEGEGGWWIPAGFFWAGWISLFIALKLYGWRDGRGFAHRRYQGRRFADGQAAFLFILSCAWVLTEAVSGDFYGWKHGLLAVGAVSGMLISHEVISLVAGGRGGPTPTAPSRVGRVLESIFYVLWSAGYWFAGRWFSHWLGLP
jgi:hypothetical protein